MMTLSGLTSPFRIKRRTAGRKACIPGACALLLASLPLTGAHAQQDAPPLDVRQVLHELDQAEAKQADASRSKRQKLLATLQGGLANGSAGSKLYEDATRAVNFAGKNQESSEFAEWKKNNAALLRSEPMQSAIRLHLHYLFLGLQQAAGGETASKTPAQFLQYAQELSTFLTSKNSASLPKEADNLLRRPVREGVFSRWLDLSDMLPNDKQWTPIAGNFDAILETNVRTPLRDSKDPQIIAAWNVQLENLGKQTQASALNIESDNLQKITRPRLIFGRANDKILLGQTNSGQKDILQIIREYPQHPDWIKWVTTLREQLGGGKTAPDVAGS